MSDSEMKEKDVKCSSDGGLLVCTADNQSGYAVRLFDMTTFVGLLRRMQTRTEGRVYHIYDMCKYVSEWG